MIPPHIAHLMRLKAYFIEGSSASEWSPDYAPGLIQWTLDKNSKYHSPLSDTSGLPVLESNIPYDAFRLPIGDTCLEFDGTSIASAASTVVAGTVSKLTVSAWYKSTVNDKAIVTQASIGTEFSWSFGISDTGAAYFLMSDDGTLGSIHAYVATGVNVDDGAWHHVVGVYDGTQADDNDKGRFCIDGVPLTTLPVTAKTTCWNTSAKLTIGGFEGIAAFDGRIQDIRVYGHRALTEAECLELYTDVEPRLMPDVGYWVMENTEGLIDWTGNGNHILSPTNTSVVADGIGRNRCNLLGYTDSASVRYPRDESNKTKAALLGTDLEYPGPCQYPISVQPPCFSCDASSTSPVIRNLTDYSICDSSEDFNIVVRFKFNSLPAEGVTKALFSVFEDTPNRYSIHYKTVSAVGIFGGHGYTSAGGSVYANFASTPLTTGVWYTAILEHLGSTTDTVKFWLDGTPHTDSTNNGTAAFSVQAIAAGATSNLSYELDGEISHAAVYSGANILSGSQITNSDTVWKFDNPTLMWTMQEGSGTTVYDVSGNDYHGTIQQTLGNAWANKTNQEHDHCILHGGRMEGDAFVGGKVDGSGLAANGAVLTIAAGRRSPNALEDRDPYDAPELVKHQMDTPFIATDNVQDDFTPNDTMFRRGDADDSHDRLITTLDSLTGTDLTEMDAYDEPLSYMWDGGLMDDSKIMWD